MGRRQCRSSSFTRKCIGEGLALCKPEGWEGGLHGLDMNEHVGHVGELGADGVFDGMCDGVAIAHWQIAVHHDVQVHVKLDAHLANPAFLDALDSGDRNGGFADGFFKMGRLRGIHGVVNGRPQEADTVEGDNGTGDERSVIIGALVAFAPNEGYGDADEGGD